MESHDMPKVHELKQTLFLHQLWFHYEIKDQKYVCKSFETYLFQTDTDSFKFLS